MYDLLIILGLTALGYFAGGWAERRHYRSIEKREQELLHIPAISMKSVPYPGEQVAMAEMVHGSAVISIDYFKRLLASLRNIFGGTVTSYESLLDRARREALLRMKESAPGADLFVNVRIETSSIGKSSRKKRVSCLEALAYGTAIVLKEKG
jgi:uncharacterized protein YbjQ (UPF0145 family)